MSAEIGTRPSIPIFAGRHLYIQERFVFRSGSGSFPGISQREIHGSYSRHPEI